LSEQEELLRAIREYIARMPEHERIIIERCAKQLRDLVMQNEQYGAMALALVGAEKVVFIGAH